MSNLNDRVEQLMIIQNEAKELFIKKNTDYGDAFAEYGAIGVLVRLGDKIKRLQSITNNSITLVEDEKLRDTLIDLHNYAAMGIMLISQGYNGDGINTTMEDLHIDNKTDKTDNSTWEITSGIFDNSDKTDKTNNSTWEIKGSMGNSYKRERYIDTTGTEVDTCSCRSFKFCKSAIRTCKHIGRE